MRGLSIPSFNTMEEAIRYSQIHKPFKNAGFTPETEAEYKRIYGEVALATIKQCSHAARKGDMALYQQAASRLRYALSKSCPWVFGRP